MKLLLTLCILAMVGCKDKLKPVPHKFIGISLDSLAKLEAHIGDSLRKIYGQGVINYGPDSPYETTAGIRAAFQKAYENGGGTIYFPAGRTYYIRWPEWIFPPDSSFDPFNIENLNL